MRIPCQLAAVMLFLAAGTGQSGELRTALIIEGGGLRPHCPALERLVTAARVNGRIRIGYLPTASARPDSSASLFIRRLSACGVPPEEIHIVNVTLDNAVLQSDSPEVVAQIRNCTAIFFGGGDQTRITRALLRPDGKPTAALEAIYAVRQAGGVIAGTSAGAAVQSEVMISASGYPDDSIDDGMDTLDFGLTKSIEQPARRGLLVTRGLGFLRDGIVDQHFNQHRGRLARLARAAIEERVRFGFGIDEDAALAVATDGTIEILGPGCVTIVDTAGATCRDSSLGCSITGVHLSCLSHGDRFEPKTGGTVIHPEKKLIKSGEESNNGNFLIPDIAGGGAVLHALFDGLGNNSSNKQIGITLKHNRHHGHGYRHIFSKTPQTLCHEGFVDGRELATVTHVRLDIEPVTLTLQSPEPALPLDLPQGPLQISMAAISFRGIMLADAQGRFRPNDPITRAELAGAITQTIRLELPRGKAPVIRDVLEGSPDAHEIALVVTAGLMPTENGAFRPTATISREEAATILVRLVERYRPEVQSAGTVDVPDAPSRRPEVLAAHHAELLKMDGEGLRPNLFLTRAEAAEAFYTIIGFPWSE